MEQLEFAFENLAQALATGRSPPEAEHSGSIIVTAEIRPPISPRATRCSIAPWARAGRRNRRTDCAAAGCRREGLAFVARDAAGAVVGTVGCGTFAPARADRPRCCSARSPSSPALKSAGIGSALMRHAIARRADSATAPSCWSAIAPYYARFGFSAEKTSTLSMPGPYERHRFLALELEDGALDGAHGVLKATGRKAPVVHTSLAA